MEPSAGGDYRLRVVLFVRLREGLTLDDALLDRIRRAIREHTTPRHVPAKIIQVPDLPRTISGKITELAVRNIIHGRPDVATVERSFDAAPTDLARQLELLGHSVMTAGPPNLALIPRS